MATATEITVLESLLAVHLDVNIWTARKKLTPSDFRTVDLPPEGLASLGSKRVCDPEDLRVFGTLKARAVSLLDRHGIRFLGGWGIPEDVAHEIMQELTTIRDDFLMATEEFLIRYDASIRDWIAKHSGWQEIIADSIVSADTVRSRMGFRWQFYRIQSPVPTSVLEQSLHQEVANLGMTLFGEVAKAATEAWHKCYAGKTEITHKALSPLRTIHGKLMGLSFVEPRVAPVAELLQTAFDSLPRKGRIDGGSLLMLQGLVSLLRDPDALVEHGQMIIDGTTTKGLLTLLGKLPTEPPDFETLSVSTDEELVDIDLDELPPTTSQTPPPILISHGLW